MLCQPHFPWTCLNLYSNSFCRLPCCLEPPTAQTATIWSSLQHALAWLILQLLRPTHRGTTLETGNAKVPWMARHYRQQGYRLTPVSSYIPGSELKERPRNDMFAQARYDLILLLKRNDVIRMNISELTGYPDMVV